MFGEIGTLSYVAPVVVAMIAPARLLFVFFAHSHIQNLSAADFTLNAPKGKSHDGGSVSAAMKSPSGAGGS